MPDKYDAVWVSHSSMGDFLKCPRAYYLKNVYKDKATRRKINLITPALSLGQAVHAVLEGLANYPAHERMERDLLADLDAAWESVSGLRGGFRSEEEEEDAHERAVAMLERVSAHPGPLAEKTVRLPKGHNGMPPNFYLSEEENLILCGLIDWLVYVPEDDSVQILDFKTGKHDESESSLQLPIYLLLLTALQRRPVSGALYWYLDRDAAPTPVELPDISVARERVLSVARQVKQARLVQAFACPRGTEGCYACRPFEAILAGEAQRVGVDEANRDLYVLT
ncbi:hypothetical protein GVX82_00295 [Patescibacteria group bacterium]|jgi:hypothetical protein|nr:hypothetical protein [Patescibacteria group bacterium]